MSSPSEIYFDSNGIKSSNGKRDATHNNTIYDLEKIVFDSLNDFNTTYSQYIRCTAVNCTDTTITKEGVINKQTDLNIKIQAYSNAYNQVNSTTSSMDTMDSTKMKTLMDTYNTVVNKRNELDVKMMEFNQTIESNYMEYKGQYDSTKYTNILITVLATSLIYYIFVKL
jgi:hypothetical protein